MIVDSIIEKDVSFIPSIEAMNNIHKIRRHSDGRQITEMVWVNKKPSVDLNGKPYNPKALIMLFLN